MILVLLWALVLLPGALRSRRTSPKATVGGFERAMEVLRHGPGRSGGGRAILVPDDAERLLTGRVRPDEAVLARRRRTFTRLAATTVVTAVLAVTLRGPFVVLLALMGVSLATYVVLLLRWKGQRHSAAKVVRSLPRRPARQAGRQHGGGAPFLHEENPRRAVAGGDLAVGSGGDSGVRVRRWGG